MKIVIAPDKFKDSLSAIKVCENLVKGLTNKDSTFDLITCPLADGGEGSLETLNYHLNFEPVELIVNDPFLDPSHQLTSFLIILHLLKCLLLLD